MILTSKPTPAPPKEGIHSLELAVAVNSILSLASAITFVSIVLSFASSVLTPKSVFHTNFLSSYINYHLPILP